ncbi:hypothetical protein Taro_043887 [Colocasia esculenta]|uniref:aldehyde oxygenase (deformylating) n=1 Tax=Colocasia esculenta TaxID=4460 RepID=A0A843WT67_COLES|nr:hypothetical protein [Colocasia esculenta]
MVFSMSEELLPVFVPVVVYWIGAAIYQLTLCPMEQYCLFTKEEEETQNLATRRQVLLGVLVNQAMQMGLATLMFMSGGLVPAGSNSAQSPSLLRVVGQMALAMLVMDCWEYFWHRWTHENKFLYKHVHAMHHHIIVPYSYGSQYIHPVDAVVGEILGGLVATLISGMSPRTAAVFFSLLTLKGLDDHCGMWFPNHPIHRWMTNNAAFHSLHHQHVGIKYNYSVHYLATWDLLLGTYLPFSVEPRKEGGYQLQTEKDQ